MEFSADLNAEPDASMLGRRFDWVVDGQIKGADRQIDVDLGGFADAAIVPSLGALIPEWLLIVPRQPCFSVAALPKVARRQLMNRTGAVVAAIQRLSGGAVVFEHGAGRFGSLNGCGVDQAHIHVVGLQPGFADYALRNSADLNWQNVDGADPWADLTAGTDYLLVMERDKTFAATLERPTSQFMRRMVADFLGCADQWDYRQHPNENNAQRTIQLFSGAFPDNRS